LEMSVCRTFLCCKEFVLYYIGTKPVKEDGRGECKKSV
jgi:hypothetical protein